MTDFTNRALAEIASLQSGEIATYGQIAQRAGNPRAARQVARILHVYSNRYNLPWHRVVGAGWEIRLPLGNGFEEQIELLTNEGLEIEVYDSGKKARVLEPY
jgi:methylated-DNA-protein-cysteine methyltransferase-like protein